MPLDTIRYIFAFAKKDLATIASVNKGWKTIAYNQDFRNLIGLPTEHFLNNDIWKKLGVEVSDEPHLPLCIYRDVGHNDFLALVHNTVKINGVETTIGPKLLVELAAKVIKSGFTGRSWIEGINKLQGSKTTHWVWMQANGIGKDEDMPTQEKSAKKAGGVVLNVLIPWFVFFWSALSLKSLNLIGTRISGFVS